MTMGDEKRRLVYSSDGGFVPPKDDKPKKAKRRVKPRDKARPVVPDDGVVRIGRETAGRKGKGVTVITGIPLEGHDLKAFVKKLKASCGSGGTLKDGRVEIQGDQRASLTPLLEARGWTVKRVGG